MQKKSKTELLFNLHYIEIRCFFCEYVNIKRDTLMFLRRMRPTAGYADSMLAATLEWHSYKMMLYSAPEF